jgi:MYXO-CTERM domain-containing protein
VDLYVNSTKIGTKKLADFPNMIMQWTNVPWSSGVIKAVGMKGGVQVAVDSITTAGAAAKVVLKPDRTTLDADGDDVSNIEVDILDASDVLVADASDTVQFTLTGSGRSLGIANADWTSSDPYKATSRKVYRGKALIVVQSTMSPGTITLTVSSGTLTPATLTLTTVAPSTAISTGGTSGTGGAGGVGGATGTGGVSGRGGSTGVGGTTGKGGVSASGGLVLVGGTTSKGGTSASGGSAIGGAPSTGGTLGSGGTTSLGGMSGSGGSISLGGTTSTGQPSGGASSTLVGGSSSAIGTAGSGATATGTASSGLGGQVPQNRGGGCSCSVSERPPQAKAWWSLGLLGFVLLRPRQRRSNRRLL